MNTLLHKLFDVREGEAPRALLMFGYVFLVICCLLMLKPVRNSLFLEKYSVKDIPYVYILVAVSAAAVTTLYARFARKMRLDWLIKISLLFILSNLLIFWLLLRFDYKGGWFLFIFYVWVAIFGVIAVSQFWTLANFVFDAREAKRLFGFVGAGAISGGIVGGYAARVALVIGTENILLICIALLSLCLLIVPAAWKRRAREVQSEQSRPGRPRQRGGNPLRMLRDSRYLAILAGIVGISVIVANLLDYQFIAIAKAEIPDKDELTAFFGFWLSTLSIISLAIQLLFTRRILGALGVGPSLFFLPVGILIGALAIWLYPVLWAAILIKVSDGSFKQSINKAGIELLMLPIPSAIKPQAKTFIDVLVDSTATGAGGLLLILFTGIWGFSVGNISLVIIPLILAWLYLALRVRKQYLEAFRTAIEKRTIDLEEQFINLQDASLVESAIKVLEGKNERQMLYVLNLLESVRHERLLPCLQELLRHPADEIRLQALKMLARYDSPDLSEEISPLVGDEHPEVRAEAIAYLFQRSGGEKKARLLREFLDHPDYRVQAAALTCATRCSVEEEWIRASFPLKDLVENTLKEAAQREGNPTEKKFIKINIARTLGTVKRPELYPYLHLLLKDEDPEVLQSAALSAGKIREKTFVPALLALLKRREIRKYARQALAEYGEDVVDELIARLKDSGNSRALARELSRALGLIGQQKTVDALLAQLNQPNPLLRFQALKALNRLRNNFPMLKFNEKLLEQEILEEIRRYSSGANILYSCQQVQARAEAQNGSPRLIAARQLLTRAMEEKLDDSLERIFRLLGLIYPPRDVYNAYLGIASARQDARANALEFLDNLLAPRYKKDLIPIVETHSRQRSPGISRGLPNLHLLDEAECLRQLIAGEDGWLKACAVYLAGILRARQFAPEIQTLASQCEPLVREAAEYALRQLEKSGGDG